MTPLEQFNRIIGARIRERREMINMPLSTFADALNVTEGQSSKYEAGKTPLRAEMLIQMAAILGCTAASFLQGLGERANTKEPLTPEAIEVARNFDDLQSPNLKHLVHDFAAKLKAYERRGA